MHDRREQVLKIFCLILGALLAFQLARFVVKGDPAKALTVPQVPSLPPEVDAQSSKGTNSSQLSQSSQTNRVATNAPGSKGTNIAANSSSGTNTSTSTNSLATAQTNASRLAAEKSEKQTNSAQTDLSKISKGDTNSTRANAGTNLAASGVSKESTTNRGTVLLGNTNALNSTNLLAQIASTNSSSNKIVSAAATKSGTNSSGPGGPRANALAMGMPMMPGMPGKAPEPPAEIKERVDRISQGEILAPVIRPMPMALLGIAGPNAFLRSPDGQTGMVKEGDKLGTLKLLQIGTNRVLIELEGEKKELTIFEGLGSQTLLPTKETKPNETTTSIKSP